MAMEIWVDIGSGNGLFNFVAWWHQAITWTNADLPSIEIRRIHQRELEQDVLKN